MPNGWTIVGTPEDLIDLLDDPRGFAERVEGLVADAGAVVGHIFWEDNPRQAHVITHVPGINADEVFERLDERLRPPKPTTRLYNGEEEIRRRG